MEFDKSDVTNTESTTNALAPIIRAYLCEKAGQSNPITYQALTKNLRVLPPNTIHQVTVALECLMEEDAAADRPLIAALVVSKARAGLPAPGFFYRALRIGRFEGDPEGPDAAAFHKAEFSKAVQFWQGTA